MPQIQPSLGQTDTRQAHLGERDLFEAEFAQIRLGNRQIRDRELFKKDEKRSF
jgi:hypothetical protein